MHSTDGPAGTTFHHHGDYVGDVILDQNPATVPLTHRVSVTVKFADIVAGAIRDDNVVTLTGLDHDTREPATVDVAVADLRAFIAARYRYEQMSRLEEASTEQLYEQALRYIPTWLTTDR